jgi:hypothetical protein
MVGGIMKVHADAPRMWTRPTQGHEATREAAIAAFAKSWQRARSYDKAMTKPRGGDTFNRTIGGQPRG